MRTEKLDTNITKGISLKWIFSALLLALIILNTGCASKGLIKEAYPEDFYRVPSSLNPEDPLPENPRFILYGDSQIGWVIMERVIEKRNWWTWKMLLFPFYQAYLLGNGIYGGINYLRRVPDYGYKEFRQVLDAMYAETERSRIDFIINVGDLVADGRRPKQWELYLKDKKERVPLFQKMPFFSARGNHDHTTDRVYGGPNYEAIFDHPPFLVLRAPDTAIFIVNSMFILDQHENIDDVRQDELFKTWFVSDAESAEPSWLEKELQASREKFKILVMHHPLISFGMHFHDWDKRSYGRDLKKKRAELLSLLRKYQVQVVFSGHEHFYEHSLLRLNSHSSQPEAGMHMIVAGSGGAPVRAFMGQKEAAAARERLRAQGYDVEIVKQEKIYNYILIETGPESLRMQAMAVTGKADRPTRLVEEIIIR